MVHSINNVSSMIKVNDSCLLGTIRICFVSSRPALTTLPLDPAHADGKVGREGPCEISDSGFVNHCPLSKPDNWRGVSMKSSIRIILAAALLSSVLFSVIAPDTIHALGPPARVIEVYPSSDTSGAADYLNIQNAMDSLEPGGKVVLAAGHFYINAGIVVEGFNGTLQGSLQGRRLQTTIEAVAPFSYTHATNYLPYDPQTYVDPVFPSMLFFEFPENKVEVKDLILQALAPDYVEPRPYWGTTTTA
jgi:hypothetical protein